MTDGDYERLAGKVVGVSLSCWSPDTYLLSLDEPALLAVMPDSPIFMDLLDQFLCLMLHPLNS